MRKKGETILKWSERIGCVHPWTLATEGKCDGCRRWPLSGRSYPDHVARAKYADLDKNA